MGKILLFWLAAISFSVSGKDCFDLAGREYRIEPVLLRAIAFRESSSGGAATERGISG